MGLRVTSSITTPPEFTRLTTLETVMDELDIDESGTYDLMLVRKIDEATADIESHIPRKLARCGITETWWDSQARGCSEFLRLRRAPVQAVASVVVDGVTLSDSEWRIDQEGGVIYRRDGNGGPCRWIWNRDVVIVYTGGFRLPEDDEYDAGDPFSLPPTLQAAALELLASFWSSRGRDPNVMEEENPGVARFRYWVGSVGDAGDLPPSVMSKISGFRRLEFA